ncbi:MAG: DUF2139 domain-containing protein [Nitrososphaeria archaeon]|nr:DUF2139 domain-containing protein [Nitrososphaeria archaeon]
MVDITKRFYRFPPRFAPEWGSGGIFGLKYYRDTLFFNLAFEAKAHFIDEEKENVYEYNLVGPKPVSGGDTYNAVDVVDDFIYFGGWVHAPALYRREGDRRTISFVNKYSHVHEYNVKEKKVRLVWKESINHPTDWTGEVSEIVYDPVSDTLLIARADGHKNLGVFSLERKNGKIVQLTGEPALKGTIFLDSAFFDISHIGYFKGLQFIDLFDKRWSKIYVEDFSKISVDGGNVIRPFVGSMISAYARLFTFVKGGTFVAEPSLFDKDSIKFVRLFDFGYSGYAPSRTMAITFGGGIITAFNSFTHGLVFPQNELEKKVMEEQNTIIGPSLLIYITPPMARIVGAFGARITSIETVGDKILLGTSTVANLARFDAMPIDVGYREIVVLDNRIIFEKPPPVYFMLPTRLVSTLNWGGIPLYGYKETTLNIDSSSDNRLYVYEYDLSLPVDDAEKVVYEIKKGKNILSLKDFKKIVSFKLEKEDVFGTINIDLN